MTRRQLKAIKAAKWAINVTAVGAWTITVVAVVLAIWKGSGTVFEIALLIASVSLTGALAATLAWSTSKDRRMRREIR